MRKRFFITFVFICISFLLIISGCNKGKDTLYFVLVPKSLTNPYWFQAEAGMKKAGEELGVKTDLIGPLQAADVTAQVNIMESLIARRVDGIAISPNDPDGVASVINKAIDVGIPVLTFDSDAPQSKRIAYVGTENYEAGRIAGKEMIKLLDDQGNYAIITGALGALNLNDRIRGFRDELAESNSKLKELKLLSCDEDTEKALMLMEDYTRSTPSLNAWFVPGSWPTVSPKGALLNALNQRTDIKILAFDTIKEQLMLVDDGLVNVVIGQRSYNMGQMCVQILYDIAVNKKNARKRDL